MSCFDYTIHVADELDCRVVSHDWDFARERAADIAEHWTRMRQQKPALFDGRVFLTCRWSMERGINKTVLKADHFETGFGAFQAWQHFGCPGNVCNSFAAAALRGSDGGYLLGEMGAHTANAGQLYFPCGTPDKSDERNGKLDLYGSVFRELAEETGLMQPDVQPGQRWTIINTGGTLACLLDVHSGYTVRELAQMAGAFLSREHKAELAGLYCVSSPSDIRPECMPAYIQAFFRENFFRSPAGQ
jgi:hypothetical protein